jgi:rod shape determining protein RodA
LAKFILGFAVMITIAMIDIRRFLQYSYVIYFLCILLLIAVQLKGTSGKGAQRWIDLGVVQLQPSELMKIGLILALARFYHSTAIERLQEWRALLMPGFLTLLPVGLVLAQPNLGTATIMVLTAAALTLMSGLRARILIICLVLGVSAIPVVWHFMHDYQKARVNKNSFKPMPQLPAVIAAGRCWMKMAMSSALPTPRARMQMTSIYSSQLPTH